MWPARPGFGRLGLRLSIWALSATAWDSSPANAVKAACGHCVKAGSGPRAESTGRARHRCWRVSPRWGDLWSPALGLGEATSLPEHPWFAGVAPLSLLWLLGRWRRPAQSSNGGRASSPGARSSAHSWCSVNACVITRPGAHTVRWRSRFGDKSPSWRGSSSPHPSLHALSIGREVQARLFTSLPLTPVLPMWERAVSHSHISMSELGQEGRLE